MGESFHGKLLVTTRCYLFWSTTSFLDYIWGVTGWLVDGWFSGVQALITLQHRAIQSWDMRRRATQWFNLQISTVQHNDYNDSLLAKVRLSHEENTHSFSSKLSSSKFPGFPKTIQNYTGWWFGTWLDYFPFHIWDAILPIDELHHFSRCFNRQPDIVGFINILLVGYMDI